jgi:tyrosine-protein kinase Etk/Wzc
MNSPQYNFQQKESKRDSNSLIEIIDYYKQKWIWFLSCIILCLIVASIYLYYALPQYEVKTSVLIKNNDSSNTLSAFADLNELAIGSGNKNLENETELLKSRKLTAQVVSSLQLNITYSDKNAPIETELFEKNPIKLVIEQEKLVSNTKKRTFEIKAISSQIIQWKDPKRRFSGNKRIGVPFQSSLGSIIIIPTFHYSKKWYGKEIKMEVNSFDAVVDFYQKAIDVKPVNDESNVLVISMKHSIPKKAEEILDRLIKIHNEDALTDKHLVASGTAQFINERIEYITKELTSVESDVEQFKTKNQLTDVFSDASMFAELGSENEKKLIDQSTQLELAQFMLQAVKSQESEYELVPTNVGITDGSINELALSYNELILERNKILKSSSEKNPAVQNLASKLSSLKSSLVQSLKNQTTVLGFEVRSLKNQDAKLSSKLGELPRFEREFRNMQRQQQIKESLYLYLLQKREETAIALAVNDSNIKVIDAAYCNGKIVSPSKKIILLGAFFIGLIVPFLFFYFRLLLDTKVRSKKDLEKLQLPILCELPIYKSQTKLLIHHNSATEITEAFRTLRTNLTFLLNKSKNKAKRVFVTSTISNEGKSVTALNLAASYSLLGKKVLLLGMDLRAPKFKEYMEISFEKGVTNYIIDDTIKWQDLITCVPDFENFDVIASGPIPPNPAELITSERVAQLIDEVSEFYDYVIVDTAPIGMVTDTALIADKADVFLYIVRMNHLDKRMLEVVEKIKLENRLGSMALVLNGVDFSLSSGYGYGYGYGYISDKKQNWFQRIFRRK